MARYATMSALPQWGEAVEAYNRERRAAEDAGDNVGVERAERRWSDQKLKLMEILASENQKATELDAAKVRIKAQYPNVPEEGWSFIEDVTQMEAAAKAQHEALTRTLEAQRVAATTAPAAPAQPQPGQPQGGSWGAPPAGSAPPPAEADDPVSRIDRELRMGVETPAERLRLIARDPARREEFLNKLTAVVMEPTVIAVAKKQKTTPTERTA